FHHAPSPHPPLPSSPTRRSSDLTRYDAITSSLVVTPLSAIRQEIVDRWKESQRDLTVRDLASRIAEAWTEGRRDRSLESRVEIRSEEHTSELQSRVDLVCRLLLE